MLQTAAASPLDVHTATRCAAVQAACAHSSAPGPTSSRRRLAAPSPLIAGVSARRTSADRRAPAGHSCAAASSTLQDRPGRRHGPSLPQTLLYEDVASAATRHCRPADWRRFAGPALRRRRAGAAGLRHDAAATAHPQRLLPRPVRPRRALRRPAAAWSTTSTRTSYDQYLQFTRRRRPFAEDGTLRAGGELARQARDRRARPGPADLAARMRASWPSRRPDAAEIRLRPRRCDEIGARALRRRRRASGRRATSSSSPAATGIRWSCSTSPSAGCLPVQPLHPLLRRRPDAATGLTGALRGELRGPRRPPGAVFAEITGGAATTNLNLHGRLTDYEIVCPGETSTAPRRGPAPPSTTSTLGTTTAADRLVLRSRRLAARSFRSTSATSSAWCCPRSPAPCCCSRRPPGPLDVWAGVPRGAAGRRGHPPARVRSANVVVGRRRLVGDDGRRALVPRRAGERRRALVPGLAALAARARAAGRIRFATVAHSGPGRGRPPSRSTSTATAICRCSRSSRAGRQPGDRVVFREMLPAEDELMTAPPGGRRARGRVALETFTDPSRSRRWRERRTPNAGADDA